MTTTRDCNGNPINYTDPTGHTPLVLPWVIPPAVKGLTWLAGGILAWGIGTSISHNTKTSKTTTTKAEPLINPLISAVTISLTKAKQKPKNKKTEKHHMVAKNDRRAAGSKRILESAGYHVNDPINLVAIKYNLHKHLHTAAYHAAVYKLMETAGKPPKVSKANVGIVLGAIRSVLTAASAATP